MISIILFVVSTSWVMFMVIKKTARFRVGEIYEIAGLDTIA